jgi:hypothetical protein
VDFGAYPEEESAGVRLVWRLAQGNTGGKITVNRFLERALQFVDRFAMEPRNIADADDVADKERSSASNSTRAADPLYVILFMV